MKTSYFQRELLLIEDICDDPETGEPGLLSIDVATWRNWSHGRLSIIFNHRICAWSMEQVLDVGIATASSSEEVRRLTSVRENLVFEGSTEKRSRQYAEIRNLAMWSIGPRQQQEQVRDAV